MNESEQKRSFSGEFALEKDQRALREADMCPRCRSNSLRIRQKKGMERLLVLLTGLRKFRCVDCDFGFRAPDRRAISRDEKCVGAKARVV